MNKDDYIAVNSINYIHYRLPVILIVVLLIVVTGNLALAQEPTYRHYTVEDGLPSSEVYHVYQDSKGYIWFSTDMGVSRFNGYEFENFDLEDGLTGNTVFEIYEDYRGRIWFLTFNMKLSYYYNGKIHRYKYNKAVEELDPDNKKLYQKLSFHIDSSDNLFIGIKSHGFYKIDSSGNSFQYSNDRKQDIEAFHIDDRWFVLKKYSKTFDNILIHDEEETIRFKIENIKDSGIDRAFILEDHDFFMCLNSNIIQIDTSQHTLIDFQNFQNRIVWMSEDRKDGLWLGTSDGAVRYKDFNLRSKGERFLEGNTVSSVLEDHEGGYWFTTLQNGVYYTPSVHILSYDEENGLPSNNIKRVTPDSAGNIWIGYVEPFIGKLADDDFYSYGLPLKGASGISCLYYDHFYNRVWMGRWDDLYFFDISDKKVMNLRDEIDLFVRDMHLDRNTIWFGESRGYCFFEDNQIQYNTFHPALFRHQVDAIYNKGDTLYIGTLGGLWTYYDGEYKHLGKENDLLYYRITTIDEYKDFLILGTRGAGLLFKKGKDVYQLTEKDGLISNSIKTVVMFDDCVWIGTNKGIGRLKFNDIPTKDIQIFNMDVHNGVPSSEINDLALYDSTLYVATKNGLSFFNVKDMDPNRKAPHVHITGVEINEKDTVIKPVYRLNRYQNYINVKYEGLSYRQAGDLDYRYRLKGLDSTWNYTNQTQKSFVSIPAGNYKFQVSASNEDGVWNETPASITFLIPKPFWETWWFYGLVGLFISGITWGIFYLRFRIKKRRRELLQDINEYKQKILRQQMNPHFIFNTLNSIQYFLLNDDTSSSITYLAKFAKLMRIVLDNSQHTFVTIEDEVRGLRLYLELESLRFEESFDYEIQIGDEINTYEYKVPALLIQPYVENSIRHGLLHKQGKGYIKIRMMRRNSSIFCIIEDNGIGRKKAEEIKINQGYLNKSLGSKITAERIDILNLLYSEDIDINYVDLTDKQDNPIGTRVEIQLPFIY